MSTDPTEARARSGSPARSFGNNFTFVTIAAAVLVAVRHSGIVLGVDAETAWLGTWPALGIFILLAVSGYLLVPSWQRDPRLVPYIGARMIRIFPALAAVVFLTVFVLGPLLTTFLPSEYFGSPQTWRYLLTLLLNPQYSLPGVFADNPVPFVINGSLWSVPAQFVVYLLVPLVALIRMRALRGATWIAIGAVSAWASVNPAMADTIIWGNRASEFLIVWPCFCVGAAIRELVGKPKVRWAAVALVVTVAGYLFVPQTIQLLNWILVPLVVVTVGAARAPLLPSAGRFGNPTFGIFLTGFPVQQTLIALFGTEHAWVSLGATVVIAVGLGYASAWTIERDSRVWFNDRIKAAFRARGGVPDTAVITPEAARPRERSGG
ncbi:acyltransferase [Herbiconiux sp. CPCC 203407]|uniref:Acyltransferase n=1 Tax=Herbiconiux oxytropis TaxID=2970915 RepID=A0AA42BUQ1_9MICO|nr:acyltransferase [Herbiconiux oxytropis]MCS5722016.1 acyltransferase [Herbiconiux oxytropis]MCS5725599.1 acyltransferase [Herbiconiux oxytropis]